MRATLWVCIYVGSAPLCVMVRNQRIVKSDCQMVGVQGEEMPTLCGQCFADKKEPAWEPGSSCSLCCTAREFSWQLLQRPLLFKAGQTFSLRLAHTIEEGGEDIASGAQLMGSCHAVRAGAGWEEYAARKIICPEISGKWLGIPCDFLGSMQSAGYTPSSLFIPMWP